MSRHHLRLLLIVFALGALAFGWPVTASGQSGQFVKDNYYAAGEAVDVPSPVTGDVVAAGRAVTIRSTVEGDVLAAGWRVALTGPALDDVRVAGREIQVAAPITGDLTAAGAHLVVDPAARIAGRAWLTGAEVDANGTFERELTIAGGTVRLNGTFRKPVRVIAEKLELLPDARLDAALSYESPLPAVIAPGATVAGPTSYKEITNREARDAHSFRIVSTLFFAVHLIVAGLLLLWLLPGTANALVQTLQAAPGRSVLYGLLLMIGVPIAAVLLLVSLIGMPVGITVAALYVVALLVGLLVTALRVGEWEARLFHWADIGTPRQRRLALIAGVLTLAALRLVPGLGTLVVFASVAAGLGAIALDVWHGATTTAAPA